LRSTNTSSPTAMRTNGSGSNSSVRQTLDHLERERRAGGGRFSVGSRSSASILPVEPTIGRDAHSTPPRRMDPTETRSAIRFRAKGPLQGTTLGSDAERLPRRPAAGQGVCSAAIRPRASAPERMAKLTTIGDATRIAAAAMRTTTRKKASCRFMELSIQGEFTDAPHRHRTGSL